jgi:hypothetical protein
VRLDGRAWAAACRGASSGRFSRHRKSFGDNGFAGREMFVEIVLDGADRLI